MQATTGLSASKKIAEFVLPVHSRCRLQGVLSSMPGAARLGVHPWSWWAQDSKPLRSNGWTISSVLHHFKAAWDEEALSVLPHTLNQ